MSNSTSPFTIAVGVVLGLVMWNALPTAMKAVNYPFCMAYYIVEGANKNWANKWNYVARPHGICWTYKE